MVSNANNIKKASQTQIFMIAPPEENAPDRALQGTIGETQNPGFIPIGRREAEKVPQKNGKILGQQILTGVGPAASLVSPPEKTAEMIAEGGCPTLVTAQIPDSRLQILDMRPDLPNLKRDIADMKRDFLKMKRDIGDLKRDFPNMKRDIGDMKRDFPNMKLEMPHLKRAICLPTPLKLGF
jgi:hypothetical protein